MRTRCNTGAFNISKFQYLKSQTFKTSSMTTDGTYLYLIVTATNGSMMKIGTGVGDTIPGKIYLEKAVYHASEVYWVYVKGKLYLRSYGSYQVGTLSVISPETFELEDKITLQCPDLFQNPTLKILNQQFPLLTDGDYLYLIGKRLKSVKKEKKPIEVDEQESDQNIL